MADFSLSGLGVTKDEFDKFSLTPTSLTPASLTPTSPAAKRQTVVPPEAFSSTELGSGFNAPQSVAAGFLTNAKVSSDSYAKARKFAKTLNLPVILGEREPERVRSEYIVNQAQELLKRKPGLAAFLKDPDNQKLINDDLDALSRIGSLMTALRSSEEASGTKEFLGEFPGFIGKNFESLGASAKQFFIESGIANSLSMMGGGQTYGSAIFGGAPLNPDIFKIDPKGAFAEAAAASAKKYRTELKEIEARATGGEYWAQIALQGTNALVMMAPAIAASIATGSPTTGLAIMGNMAFVSRYGEARDRGFDRATASAEALLFAALEVVSERIPLKIILGNKAKGLESLKGQIPTLLKAMGAEGLQETFIEAVDIGYDKLVLDKTTTWSDIFRSLSQAGIIGASVGGTMRGGVMGLNKAVSAIMPDPGASAYEKALSDIKAEVDQAKTQARDPTVMKAALDGMADGSEVFIAADELLELEQNGDLTFAQLEEAGLTTDTLEAMQLGGDVKIPVADLLALRPEVFALLSPSVRRAINSDTVREAEQKLQERDQTIDRLLSDMQAQLDEDASALPIYNTVSEQLRSTGKYSDAQVDRMSTLMAESYETRAANTTKTAEELFLEENVTIRTGAQPAAQSSALEQGRLRSVWDTIRGKDSSSSVVTLRHGGPALEGGKLDLAFTGRANDPTSISPRETAGIYFSTEGGNQATQFARGGRSYEARLPAESLSGVVDFMSRVSDLSSEMQQTLADLAAEAGIEIGANESVGNLISRIRSELENGTERLVEAGISGHEKKSINEMVIWDQALLDSAELFDVTEGDPVQLRQDLLEQSAKEFGVSTEVLQAELAEAGGDITQTPRFKEWFKQGKLLDAEGKPLALFHRTEADIEAFVPGGPNLPDNYRGDDFGLSGRAVFLSTDPAAPEANFRIGDQGGENVLPVYSSLQNPFYYDPSTSEFAQAVYAEGDPAPGEFPRLISDAAIARLREDGHDGVVVQDADGNISEVLVFDPSQIKSTFNRGAFDPADPNILFQDAPDGALEQARATVQDPEALGLTADEAARINPIYRPEAMPTKRLGTNEKAAKWLEDQFDGDAIIDFTEVLSEEQINQLGRLTAAEAQLALESTGNAADWYSEAVLRAMNVASIKYPMLQDDAAAAEAGFGTSSNARFAFTYIMAVTSQNLDVAANSVAADTAFSEMVESIKSGDYSMKKEWGTGDKQAAMGKNFEKFLPMLNAMNGGTPQEQLTNLDKMFREKRTVREWEVAMKAAGIPYSPPGNTAKDAVVYGSSTLGPKIGNGFWQNLNGNFDPLTIDLWMRRTWGRLTGKSIGQPDAVPAQRRRLKAAISKSRSNEQGSPDLIEMARSDLASSEAALEAHKSAGQLEGQTKKDFSAETRRLNKEVSEGKALLSDLAGLKAPEPWKAEYGKTDDALLAYSNRLITAWSKEYKKLQETYGSANIPTELQPTWARAAKAIKSNLSTPLDQIANGTQRKQVEAVGQRAREILSERGIDVTTADLQALLWYPEKELWGGLRDELEVDADGIPVVTANSLNESYDTTFARIFRSQGYEVEGIEGDGAGGSGQGAVSGQDAGSVGPEGTAGTRQAAADIGRELFERGGQQPALEQTRTDGPRGSFRQERDTYGNLENIISLLDDADLTTFLHEGGHFWLYQMQKDLNSDYLTEQGRARLQKQWDSTTTWFRQNSKQAWSDIQKMAKSARRRATANPDDAVMQERAVRLETAVSRAKRGNGDIYMAEVAANFMNGNVENGTDLEVVFHELWARGVEKYLGEGSAPSASLRSAFASFSAWMTSIYGNLKNLNVTLDDNIRGVFDRMLATEEAINEEKQRDAYKIPQDVRALANEAELAELEQLVKEAELEAQQELQAVVADEISQLNGQEYKAAEAEATEQITKEVYSEPLYAAIELSRKGVTQDGTQLTDPDGKPSKLQMPRDEFVALFGVDAARAMPRGLLTKNSDAATDVATFVMLSGFESQDAMVTEMTSPHLRAAELISQRVAERMKDEYSSLTDPGVAADKAAVIISNDKQVELAELQARILKRKTAAVLRSAAQRKVLEEGAPSAVSDRERAEDIARASGSAPTASDAVPEQLSAAASEAQRQANIPQRTAQSAARRQVAQIMASFDIQGIKQAAKLFAGKAKVRDLTPQRYIAAADRLARKANKAIAVRDYASAATLLEQKALNLAIAKEAGAAQTKVSRAVKRLRDISERSDKKVAKYRELKIFNAARFILSSVGINRNASPDLDAVLVEAQSVLEEEAHTELAASLNAVVSELAAYTQNGAVDYRNLPYDVFTRVTQDAQSISKAALDANTLLMDGKRIDRETVVNEMEAQTSDRVPVGRRKSGRGTPEQRKSIEKWGTLKAALTRVESWATAMDGGRPDGVFTTYIVKPVFDSISEYYAERAKPLEALVEALRPLAGSLTSSGPIAAPELDGYVFQNKAELIHAILHTGNESNKQKLLRAGQVDINTTQRYQWSKENEDGTLDTSAWQAFMRRMFAQNIITKSEMDLVQTVWDIFKNTQGAAQKAHYRMHGFYFDTLEATPVETPFGTYPGGYVPAITDKMMDIAGGARIDADNLASQQNASMFPNAEAGFTKSRVEAYAEPLELDLLRIPSHFDRVMKFAYLGPTVREVAQLVTSRRFRSMANRFDRNAVDQLLVPWLQRVVRQSVTTQDASRGWSRALSSLSNRIGIQTMAGNIVNAAQQVTGIPTAAAILPSRLLMKHLFHYKEDGVGIRTFISQHSAYMDVRFRNGVSDMLEEIDKILTDTTPLNKTQVYAQRYAYVAQQFTQNMVDPVVWMAAFDHAKDLNIWKSAYKANVSQGVDVAEAKADAAAAYYADSIVRQTQSPMGAAEISRIETGTPLWRLFIKFYGYFNSMLNFNASRFDIIRREIGAKGKGGKFFYLYLMGIAIPAIVAEAISMGARGDFDVEDDEELAVVLAQVFLVSQIKFVAAAVPGGSAAVNRFVGMYTDVPYDDRLSFSPVLSIFDSAINGTANLIKDAVTTAVEGEPARDASRIVRDGLNTFALLVGLPTNWFSKPVQYLIKTKEGNADPENVADYVQGAITGRSAKKR
jgi:hypothetical protein